MTKSAGAVKYGRIAAALLACAAGGALSSVGIATSFGGAASAAYYYYCPGGGAGGNYGYCPPTTTTTTTTTVPLAEGGNFVIGDLNSAVGTPVTFWGAQWWKKNRVSGGPAPPSFKGFANTPDVPACGIRWSTDPGNSSDPPPTVPPLMAVIVSSSISKSGSTISGNTSRVVLVRTDPGYAPNPGHEGTGTVVSVVC